MAENILHIGRDHQPTASEKRSLSRSAVAPFRSAFSRLVSVISAILLLAALGSILWYSATVPKLDRLEEPERALDLMVSRIMEAQDGLQRSPVWQQRLAEWIVGSSEKERLLAIQWYQELADTTGAPAVKLRLAILQAEIGQAEEALAQAAQWWELDAPMP